MAGLLPSVGLPPLGEPSQLRLGFGAGRARARQDYRRKIRLGRAGNCPETPMHLIFTIDSSGSVTGGNDCVGQRFVEADVPIEVLGRACRCGRERVSVLHFDHPVSNDLMAADVTDREAVSRSLSAPLDGRGCSTLGPSLATARQLALNHPDHRNILVALTDFELFDPVSVWESFVTFPGEIFACVLGGRFHGFDDDPRVHVTHVDRTQRPGTLAEALFATMTSERTPSRRRLVGTVHVKDK